jgi:hypothetical protein
MKVPLGFMLGFVAGAYVFSKLTEEQRAGFVDKIDHLATTGRTGKITGTFRQGMSGVADVATDRITDATETATDAAASALSGDDASNGARPGTSAITDG